MKNLQKGQQGAAHLIIILVIVVVIIGALGFAAWRILGNVPITKEDIAKKAAETACAKETDQNICKFYSSWKADQKFRMTSTDQSGATTVIEIDGDKTHMKITGEMAYETIAIGKDTYIKAGDIWYKQTAADVPSSVNTDSRPTFNDPSGDTSKAEVDKTVYKNLGKEACGKLTCFKYEIVDPTQTDIKQYLWFDDKDYQMQHSQTVTSDGTSDQVYEYDNISVNVPSPVTVLGPDQYIIPGQAEPATMPSVPDASDGESQ